MSNPKTGETFSNFPWKKFGTLLALGAGLAVLAGCESPVSIEDDVSATLPIDKETHHSQWTQFLWTGKSAVPIVHPAYDTFTFTIDGQEQTIRVSPEAAEKYNEGDKVEVTYDKRHYKDGSAYVSDVKLK